jgi:hypothetical protein
VVSACFPKTVVVFMTAVNWVVLNKLTLGENGHDSTLIFKELENGDATVVRLICIQSAHGNSPNPEGQAKNSRIFLRSVAVFSWSTVGLMM